MTSAAAADSRENAAVWLENAAVREAAFGNLTEARQSAHAGLRLAPSAHGVQFQAALALAMSGDEAESESIARQLNRVSLDPTDVEAGIAVIQAQTALIQNRPAAAIGVLESLLPMRDYGQIAVDCANLSCLYPIYIRGQAYLAAGQGNEAAAEFSEDS